MRLGAILAGGASRRFGTDKALAMLNGTPLLEHVARSLRPQTDALLVVGRTWQGLASTVDAPGPGLGPLGGLAGALHYAGAHGFSDVVTAPCDCPDLPADLATRLAPGPAYIQDMPVVGLWPVDLLPKLLDHIARSERRSMLGWASAVKARAIELPAPPTNCNRPADLEALRQAADRQSSR